MENSPLDVMRKANRQFIVALVALAGAVVVFLLGGPKGIAMLLLIVMMLYSLRGVALFRDLSVMRRLQQATRARMDAPEIPIQE
jgi:hypothetical protein